MAKKKKADETPVVIQLPGSEVAVIVTVDQHPAELSPVVNEFRDLVPHQKANLHLASFAPLFHEMQGLEAEIAGVSEDNAAGAKELRLKYQKVRTGAKTVKEEGKKDILSEGRLIDGLFNTIAGVCELKEAALKKIETALADREKEAKDLLKEERKAALDALDYDTEFLTLEDMPEASFNKLLAKATELKNGASLLQKQREEQEQQAENNRLAAEAKQRVYDDRVGMLMAINAFPVGDVNFTIELSGMDEDEFTDLYAPLKEAHDNEAEHRNRVSARVEKLHKVGVFYVEDNRAFESDITGRLDVDIVEFGTDEIFNAAYTKIETAVANDKEQKAAKVREEQEAAQRLLNRVKAVTGLGLLFTVDKYEGYGHSLTDHELKILDADVFKARYDALKLGVQNVKDEQAETLRKQNEANAELQRKENERKAAELETQKQKDDADKAPDVEKLRVLYNDIKALNIPTLVNPELEAFMISTVRPMLTEICKTVSKKARAQ